MKTNLFFVNFLCSFLFLTACGGNGEPAGKPDGGSTDGQVALCKDSASRCDDKVDCTRDSCDESTGECRHQADHALCSAGTVCMPKEGCKSPPPCATDADCPDADNGPCMQEYCEPASSTCRWNPLDKDGDGHAPQICADIGGDDCDDDDYSRNPGIEEQCNGVDDNCNGAVDDIQPGAGYPFYQDGDGDEYGNPDVMIESCSPPDGYVGNKQDCDDTDAEISPAAAEICDGLDNDCDGNTDEESEENPLCGSCLVCQNATCVNVICEEELVCIPGVNRCRYNCPDPDNPPEVCKPKEAREADCNPFSLRCHDGFYESQYCTTDEECQRVPSREETQEAQCVQSSCDKGFNAGMDCYSDADCQVVPQEAMDNPNYPYPPCVCWGLPCELVGRWECPGEVWDYTDAEFYDNSDGYCRVHFPQYPRTDLYYEPGNDHLQRPPSGPFEEKATLLNGGSQMQSEGDDVAPFICDRVEE